MTSWRWLTGASAVAVAIAAAPALRAEPPARPRSAPSASAARVEQQERPRQRVERLLERRGSSPSALPSALPVPSASNRGRLPELAGRWAELAATRQARREKHRAALVQEFGARLQEPSVRAELALHSQRVAELSRLEFLAKHARSGAERDKLLGRIEKLRAHEATRHQRTMAKLARTAPRAVPAPSASGEAKP